MLWLFFKTYVLFVILIAKIQLVSSHFSDSDHTPNSHQHLHLDKRASWSWDEEELEGVRYRPTNSDHGIEVEQQHLNPEDFHYLSPSLARTTYLQPHHDYESSQKHFEDPQAIHAEDSTKSRYGWEEWWNWGPVLEEREKGPHKQEKVKPIMNDDHRSQKNIVRARSPEEDCIASTSRHLNQDGSHHAVSRTRRRMPDKVNVKRAPSNSQSFIFKDKGEPRLESQNQPEDSDEDEEDYLGEDSQLHRNFTIALAKADSCLDDKERRVQMRRIIRRIWQDKGVNFEMTPKKLAFEIAKIKIEYNGYERTIALMASTDIQNETDQDYFHKYQLATKQWSRRISHLKAKLKGAKYCHFDEERCKQFILKELIKQQPKTYDGRAEISTRATTSDIQLDNDAKAVWKEFMELAKDRLEEPDLEDGHLNVELVEEISRGVNLCDMGSKRTLHLLKRYMVRFMDVTQAGLNQFSINRWHHQCRLSAEKRKLKELERKKRSKRKIKYIYDISD